VEGMEERRGARRNVVGKSEGKRPLTRPRHRRENNMYSYIYVYIYIMYRVYNKKCLTLNFE